jgi:hypothetical protein
VAEFLATQDQHQAGDRVLLEIKYWSSVAIDVSLNNPSLIIGDRPMNPLDSNPHSIIMQLEVEVRRFATQRQVGGLPWDR